MTEIKGSNIRSVMMDSLKANFGGFTLWRRIETQLVLMCADIPDDTTEERRLEVINVLKKIKGYLQDNDVSQDKLKFLDDEIEMYEETKQISLYVDEDDRVPKEVVLKYAQIGKGQEGLVAIHHKYNYEQLKYLTNGVYNQSKLLKFYISKEKTLYGKIVAEIYEHPQKIPIATLCESKKTDDEGLATHKKIFLFGEKINGTAYSKLKVVDLPFCVYRFITENNQELILLTPKRVEIGDYIVTGVTTHCDDFKTLTDSSQTKLPTKLPFLFAQSCKNRIIKFSNHGEFRNRLSFLKISRSNLFDFPFTVKHKGKRHILLQPNWYKWLVWSWLCHNKKGMFNNYPLHLLIVGPKHSGKSLLLNCLHEVSQESRDIFSGSSSTLKSLIPSFYSHPAKLGYLAESNRFSYCDEFLRCLIRTKTTKDGSAREESVAMMNDLLEHQKREAGSGISKVKVNMTSRIIATTNPIRGMNSVSDLIEMMDESFMSRWLVLRQTEEQVKIVRDCKDADLKILDFDLENNDWVSSLDYLHNFSAEYDIQKVEEVLHSCKNVLSETLAKHYDARHMHHIECVMDGLVKARCFMDKDMSFKAKQEDYDRLEKVWKTVIRSWVDPQMIHNLPVDQRIFYLPEACQSLYFKLCKVGKPLTKQETEIVGNNIMKKDEFVQSLQILLHHNVLLQDNGFIRPHYMSQCDMN